MRRLLQQDIPDELAEHIDDSGLAIVQYGDGSEEVVWVSKGASVPRRMRHQQGIIRLGALAIVVAFLLGLGLGLLAGDALGAERCHTKACAHRVWIKHRERFVAPHRAWLRQTGECETGDLRDPWHAATGNGYYGRFQFAIATWRAAGGRGRPDHASHLEQEYRAARLMVTDGAHHWPVCG
jgi:hypothetical protein